MLSLVLLYKWAILAGVVAAPALAIVGCHLAARDKAMQTLCVGQGASLGVLVGLGILKSAGVSETSEGFWPLLTSLLFSVATFFLSEKIVNHRQASKNTFYSAIFASLLATGHLVCALSPHLENHMTQVFFGDLATLTNPESIVSIVLGGCLLAMMIAWWRPLSGQSFSHAIFGDKVMLHSLGLRAQTFNYLSLFAVAFSVQFLGFLFTVACLFLPTTLLVGFSSRTLKRHFSWCAGLAASATLAGFLLSLEFTRLPTVPVIVMIVLVAGGAGRVLSRLCDS